MRSLSAATILVVSGLGGFACGSRTALDGIEGQALPFMDLSDGAPERDAAEGGASERDASVGGASEGGVSEEGGTVCCDFRRGPVSPGDMGCGLVLRCAPPSTPVRVPGVSYCVDLGGQWGCCEGPGPYDGPMGVCSF